MTAGFVANMTYTGHDSGLDRGFIRYDDFVTTPRQLSWTSAFAQTPMAILLRQARTLRAVAGALRRFNLQLPPIRQFVRKPAPVVTAEFLDWQARHPDRRFFAFLNYFDAHKQYDLPRSFERRFSTSGKARDVYDGALAYIDQSVDSLLAELDRRGVLNNTVVAITADHGEYFGEHGIYTHEEGLHRIVLHVPLIILARGRAPSGTRVPNVVSLRDIPATLLQLAGVSGDELPGHSLATQWTAPAPSPAPRSPAAAALLKTSWTWAFVSDDLYWIRDLHGREELYERSDTAEVRNAAADSSARSRLRAEMNGVAIVGFPKL
jgi:arylsulfatase A-like enzyme